MLKILLQSIIRYESIYLYWTVRLAIFMMFMTKMMMMLTVMVVMVMMMMMTQMYVARAQHHQVQEHG